MSELSTYEQQAIDFLTATGTKFKATYVKHGKHFAEDKDSRDIYRCTLSNKNGKASFMFGQSIANMGKAPTAYDLLTCLTKYEPGSFENFCRDYGYDTDSRTAERTYKAVCKEWEKVERLFSSDDLEKLQEIN